MNSTVDLPNQTQSTPPRHPLLRLFLPKFILLILLFIFLGGLSYYVFIFGPQSRASKEFYTGYLVKGRQQKCARNPNLCYRLLDAQGIIQYYVTPDGVNIKKKELNDLLGQAVRIKKAVKIPNPERSESPSLVTSKIEVISELEIDSGVTPKKFAMGLGGFSPLSPTGFIPRTTPPVTYFSYTQEAGLNSATTSIDWFRIEPTPGVYNWAPAAGTERQLEGCQNHSLPTCNIMIGAAPNWAVTKSTQSLGSFCPNAPINMNSADPNDATTKQRFLDFVKKVVERYDGDGTDDILSTTGKPLISNSYLIYNEPDYYRRDCGQSPWNTKNPEDDSRPWSERRDGDLNKNGIPDYQDYAELQKDFYYAVKAANPNARVSFGTYGNFEIHDRLFSDDTKTFLYKVIDYLFKKYQTTDPSFSQNFPYFDIANVHYYKIYHCNWPFPEFDDYAQGGIRGAVNWMKDIFSRFTINGKPLERSFVISEISQPVPYIPGSPPENDVAINLWKIFAQSFSTGADEIRWYDLGFGDPQYGLIDNTTTPPRKRPAFFAYQRLFNGLNGYGFHSLDMSNYNNLEGYIFTHPTSITSPKKEVLWSVPTRPGFCSPNASAPTIQKNFIATSIQTLDPFGETQNISDGQVGDLDNRRNGKVRINITSTPLLVSIKN